ncbi:MAG: chromophore lyase CpcT/CpeT [Cyanobacteriota bacterium]|nr:chromophore lyase CpcT/CpeT [Cyanobacteriota bacterium]
MKIDKAIALFITTTHLFACSLVANTTQRQVMEVVKYLTGVMDTTAQAEAIPGMPKVRMTTCVVKVPDAEEMTQRSPSIFLYQEQAITKTLNQPYRQRFLQISPSADGEKVESATFVPRNKLALVGFCRQPLSERLVNVEDLGDYRCSVFLKRSGSEYIGQTQLEGCPANFKGVVTVTNKIILNADGMETFDRGYDQKGNQVWGAENRPYHYQRVKSE